MKKETYTNYIEFYEKVFKKKIKFPDQPMIQVQYKKSQDEAKYGWFVVEFCQLIGLNESDTEDHKFMKELAYYTQLKPDQVTKQIDKCIELFKDETKREMVKGKKDEKEVKNEIKEIKKGDIYNTANKKREFYGIEIIKIKNISSCHIIQPKFDYGKQQKVALNKDTEVARLELKNDYWICLYHESLENSTFNLLKDIELYQKRLGIEMKSNDSNWIPMNSNNVEDWESEVEEKMENRNIEFVIFFISKRNNHLYNSLKNIHYIVKDMSLKLLILINMII